MHTCQFTASLATAMSDAKKFALAKRHKAITVEHLIFSFCHSETAIGYFTSAVVDVTLLKSKLEEHLEGLASTPAGVEAEAPVNDTTYNDVLQKAAEFSKTATANQGEISCLHVLMALYEYNHASYASWLLLEQDVAYVDFCKVHNLCGDDHEKQKRVQTGNGRTKNLSKATSTSRQPARRHERSSGENNNGIAEWTTEITGEQVNCFGRDLQVKRAIEILSRQSKNNPIFVGDAGVGKTTLVHAIARAIRNGDVPDNLKNKRILELNITKLLAGTRFRGDFEERVSIVMDEMREDPELILFIDEIHTLIGAGDSTGGLSAGDMLKPGLVNGSIRCIGTTTFKEYRHVFARSEAMARRFQRIDVPEPTEDEACDMMLAKCRELSRYHSISFPRHVIEASIRLAVRHIKDRRLPDKAVDVLDEAAAAKKMTIQGTNDELAISDVELAVSKIAAIPLTSVDTDERGTIISLPMQLETKVFGQKKGIAALCGAFEMYKAGLHDSSRPIGTFLFHGPTGVGKTEICKQFANLTGMKFLHFDMTEYCDPSSVSRFIGAAPGHVGFEKGGALTDAVDQSPHCFILLDEIEKATDEIHQLLLQVADEGRLTDSSGKVTSFSNVILVMTTNAGANDAPSHVIGFGNTNQTIGDNGIESAFRKEWLARIDEIVHFEPLAQKVVEQLVDKNIAEVSSALSNIKQPVTLRLDSDARSWLVEFGYTKDEGARLLRQLITRKIKRPIAREIVGGHLSDGGVATVYLSNGSLRIRCEPEVELALVG
ncbi:ATP-dependent Clp protease ATP-binding subunit ClpA [Thalassospira xiamenensis]|uniref:ATP-dependent Clp protease ATP-binding subunit ClpA n=2 Tax=Thalassospira xiamenensis TaxID=220697 RepID=A0A285TTD7_9PROT|nr:ATP-dependent Clp protease ATP-binding subunit ClpA [Thalassospira xiamenensis]